MKDLSTHLLLAQLEFLLSAYDRTPITFSCSKYSTIVDNKGADLLRLLNLVTDELVKRIELPF